MVSSIELAWAAGFLEGEGDFSIGGHAHIRCSQVQLEPLDRLQRLFGGYIKKRKHRNGKPTWSDFYLWHIDKQADVIGIAMTLYSFMSPKRKDSIRKQIQWWRVRPLVATKDSEACARGHKFSEENTYMYRGSRNCKTCRTQHMKEYRERLAHA